MFYTKPPAMVVPMLMLKLLLLLHVVLGDIPNACPTSPDTDTVLCQLSECLAMADELLETMNSSRDPCQNFYEYACGGWLDQQFLNPKKTRVTKFVSDQPLVLTRKFLAQAPKSTDLPFDRKAKTLYASCINFTNTSPRQYSAVTRILAQRFFSPVCRNCGESTFYLELLLKEAFKLGVHLLFTMRADPSSFTDPVKRQQRSKLYIGKPVLGMPIDRYGIFSRHEPYRKIYANKIVRESAKFGHLNRTWVTEDALEIVTVDVALAMIYNNLTNKGATRIMNLQELTTEYGQLINWTRFVSDLASSPEIGITDITPQEFVIVTDPEYLRQMIEYFTGLPRRVQENYIYWRVMDSLQYVLIEDHRKLKYFLTSEAARTFYAHPYTELDCVKYVSEVFDLVVHRLLYKDLLNTTIHSAGVIMDMIQIEFEQVVDRLAWMYTYDKNAVKGKLNRLQTKFSFHDSAMNSFFLNSYFSNITVNETDFISNVIQARKAAFVRDLKNIRRTKVAEPPTLPHQILAEYSRQLNTLYLSPIILHHPFFNNINDWMLVFPGFGSIVAQEIMHGFDTTGYRYNSHGTIGNWWAASTIQHFLDKAVCLANQYSSFNYSTAGINVNGSLTLDSNIADVSGLKMAYKAYKTHIASWIPLFRLPGVTLSKDQLFFVKYAQMRCTKETHLAALSTLSSKHSPDEFRVNGPLRNLPEFATTFNCPVGSFMNPRNKCVVW